jgi:MFS family permease
MEKSVRNKLFIMMILEIAVWGAWLPLIFGYLPSLGFNASEQAWILNAFALGAIVAMFFSNQFVDRKFAAEKFMAFSHLVGGVAMLGLAFIKAPDMDPAAISAAAGDLKAGIGTSPIFWPFFGLMLLHCLLYVPTLSIANSIAFTHLKDAKKDYGFVRMGGTLGWILVAWPFVFILVDWAKVPAFSDTGFGDWLGAVFGTSKVGAEFQAGVKSTFLVSGIISLLLAGFSLTLPHTPPKPSAGESLAWVEAFQLLKKPAILILFIVTFIDAFVHNLYFAWTGSFLGAAKAVGGVGIPGNWVMPVMTIGQVAELLTMAMLGVVLKRLGWRKTMIIGILGHAIRFGVYALCPNLPGVIIAVQILHGICYAFFFATLYIFIDEQFPKDIRTSAQGLFNMLVFGFGPLASFYFGPQLMATYTKGVGAAATTSWDKLFIIPCGAAVVAAVILALLFHPAKTEPQVAGGGAAPH